MDCNLITELTLFAAGRRDIVIIRVFELPASAAWLACKRLGAYAIQEVQICNEDMYQLSHATGDLWASGPPPEMVLASR